MNVVLNYVIDDDAVVDDDDALLRTDAVYCRRGHTGGANQRSFQF